MEYSKEDLIEAKSKILGYEENIGTEESKKIWEVCKMTEKSTKPQLRFAGFDDTWEQRKLGDVA